VDAKRWDAFCRKRDAIVRETRRLEETQLGPEKLSETEMIGLLGSKLTRSYPLMELLRRPGVSYKALMLAHGVGPGVADPSVAEQIEIQAKYQGYISRQQDEICRVAEHEQSRLPSDLDYLKVHGLSVEVQQKLSHTKPETLGQAMRVPGVTPAAISLLLVHLRRHAASLNPPA
jgi:tRNA uridine 5-carboxymethylaminomethyl modification enzyme